MHEAGRCGDHAARRDGERDARGGGRRRERRASTSGGPAPGDEALERALAALTAVRPELRDAAVAVLGAGLDHRAYRVGDLVLRLRDDADGSADPAREAALLEAVRRRCPVPVPTPAAVGEAWLAYPLLPGVPLLALDAARRARHAGAVAATLGRVLAALWATPAAAVAELVEDDRTPLAAWRDEAAALAARLAGELPADARAGLERALAEPLPAAAPARVFSHNDLGCEHVLVDPRRGSVTGIVDWSDAAVVDPAKDLGLLLRDLGDAACERALRAAAASLPVAEDPRPRARLYARCLALEDLAFGLESGQARYAEAARAALRRLACASR